MRPARYLAGFVLAAVVWAGVCLVAAFYGWWLSPVADPGDQQAFFDHARQRLVAENPGASALVMIESGEPDSSFYSDAVGPDTLFATASLSKWVAAIGVMKLVETGDIELESPVPAYLTRWQLPPSDEFDLEGVTVGALLSHTAGLTDALGFGDYLPDETVPTLIDSLRKPRASRLGPVAIEVGIPPGDEWRYSGGGYLILELLVEEVSGRSFSEHMQAAVFSPLEMHRATYEYIGDQTDATLSYDSNGKAQPHFRYASRAATGFTTSAADLSRLALAMLDDNRSGSLETSHVRSMRSPHGYTLGTPIWGLGTMLYVATDTGDYVFGHDGGNEPAINSTVRMNPDTGDALIVLITGHPNLATRIGSEWVLWQTGYPDFLSIGTVLESALLPSLTGILILLGLLGWRYRATRATHASA